MNEAETLAVRELLSSTKLVSTLSAVRPGFYLSNTPYTYYRGGVWNLADSFCQYCYGDMGNRGGTGVEYIATIICAIVDDKKSRAYLDWLFNRSPFKCGFMNTVDEMFEWKVNFVKCDNPGNIIFAGMMLVRAVWEWKLHEQWYAFVEAGLSEWDAFILIHNVKLDEKNKIVYEGFSRGHTAFNLSAFDDASIKNWVAAKPVFVRESFEKKDSYIGIEKMFRTGELSGPSTYQRDIRKAINEQPWIAKSAAETKNPFKPINGTPVNKSCSLSDFVSWYKSVDWNKWAEELK